MGASDGDLIAWAFSNDGNFTLWSAYIAAKGLIALNHPTSHLSWIWKVKAPPKFLIFIWLCPYCNIPVREVLHSRGLNLDQKCPICNSGSKSINHLLHECPHSVSFWNRFGPLSSLIHTFDLPITDWLHANCTFKLASRHHHVPWHLLFLFGI